METDKRFDLRPSSETGRFTVTSQRTTGFVLYFR
jgi:hypothetical protein